MPAAMRAEVRSSTWAWGWVIGRASLHAGDARRKPTPSNPRLALVMEARCRASPRSARAGGCRGLRAGANGTSCPCTCSRHRTRSVGGTRAGCGTMRQSPLGVAAGAGGSSSFGPSALLTLPTRREMPLADGSLRGDQLALAVLLDARGRQRLVDRIDPQYLRVVDAHVLDGDHRFLRDDPRRPEGEHGRMQGSRSRRECVIGPRVYALAGRKA